MSALQTGIDVSAQCRRAAPLDRAESFRIFQERILNNYDAMVESDNFVLMDGTVRVNKLQKLMRQIVGERISLQQFAPKKR